MFVRECLVADGDLVVTFAFSLLGSSSSLALIESVVAGRLEENIDLHLFSHLVTPRAATLLAHFM